MIYRHIATTREIKAYFENIGYAPFYDVNLQTLLEVICNCIRNIRKYQLKDRKYLRLSVDHFHLDVFAKEIKYVDCSTYMQSKGSNDIRYGTITMKEIQSGKLWEYMKTNHVKYPRQRPL